MQSCIIDIEQVKASLGLLNQIYDHVRILHPLSKQVFNIYDGQAEVSESRCFDLWASGKMCSNCISIRAYQQKEIQFKLEHSHGKIHMVMAVPVLDGTELLVLELVKDVTHSLAVENFSKDNNHPLLKLLNDMGQLQIRDALTGMLNRRFIDERLPVDIHNSLNDSKPLSVILADIDYFKKVNDTYGHVAGDYILKEFSRLLQCAVPKDGWAARYGGEEFLISLLNTNDMAAQVLAEEIRSKVENHEFLYEDKVIKITSSFGVCTLHHTQGLTMEALIECTDKNLYQAKNSGRNRVVATKIS